MNTDSSEKPAANRPRRFGARPIARFIGSRDGAAAVEFGIVALPFFALLFAVLETAMVFFAQVMLESGLNEAARLIRTGQAQQQGFDEAAFATAVCEGAFAFISCGDALHVDVRSFSEFQSVSVPDALNEDGELNDSFTYDQGTDGDVVVARVFYEYPIFTPTSWHIGLGNMSSGNRLLSAAMVFRNEPFGAILEE